MQTSVIVVSLTAGVSLYTREVNVAWFVLGSIVCNGIAKGIKTRVRQPRPTAVAHTKTTYGMPSTHSTSISFFVTYMLLSLDPVADFLSLPRPIVGAAIFAWGYAIAWSRVKLGYHSVDQVMVGVTLGAAIAVGWRKAWIGPLGLQQYWAPWGQRWIDIVWAETGGRLH